MNWLALLAALTPTIALVAAGLRWLGIQIWRINQLLATQNEAIKWQNAKFQEMGNFDSSVAVQIDRIEWRLSDIERYLQVTSAEHERPFYIRQREGKL
jgi:hypothetical protein